MDNSKAVKDPCVFDSYGYLDRIASDLRTLLNKQRNVLEALAGPEPEANLVEQDEPCPHGLVYGLRYNLSEVQELVLQALRNEQRIYQYLNGDEPSVYLDRE